MPILGIETSCDETGLALVREGRVLADVLASQEDVHSLFGGVVPEIASREHYRLLPRLFARLLDKAGIAAGEVSGVAVARGPGLLGCLLVGLSFAKGLSLSLPAPLVGVNHLHAHLLAAGLQTTLTFPALGVLVSGGHTHLYRVASPTSFELLGRTLDDAAGEAFDKVAKLLNLPYPGGRHVDELARLAEPDPRLFPRPYCDNDNLDFSFSGLKTAVATYIAAHPELRLPVMPLLPPGGRLADAFDQPSERLVPLARMLASFSLAVADTLRIKAERALRRQDDIRAVIVAGGVAANSYVRETFSALCAARGLRLVLPAPGLCTDNAAMIAYAGELLLREGYFHDQRLEAIPRGRAVPADWTGAPPAVPCGGPVVS